MAKEPTPSDLRSEMEQRLKEGYAVQHDTLTITSLSSVPDVLTLAGNDEVKLQSVVTELEHQQIDLEAKLGRARARLNEAQAANKANKASSDKSESK